MNVMQRLFVVGGLLAVGCLFLAGPGAVLADDDGWSIPKPKLPELKLPKLPSIGIITPKNSRIKSPVRTAEEPSTLDKLNAGTKKFFTKTKETLTPPWKKPAPPAPLVPPTGVRRTTRTVEPAKKTSRWAGFFKAADEPAPPRRPPAPHDFIGQPRPDF